MNPLAPAALSFVRPFGCDLLGSVLAATASTIGKALIHTTRSPAAKISMIDLGDMKWSTWDSREPGFADQPRA